MAFRQCWAITNKGRCENNALKDKRVCSRHRDRKITIRNHAWFLLKKHLKKYWSYELIGLLLTGCLGWYEVANTKLSLLLDPTDNYPNSVFLKLENKSRIFSIKDVEVTPEIFYSSYKGPIVITNVQRGIKSIEEIQPEKLDTINFNVIDMVRELGMQQGAVCFCVKYKGDVGFIDLEREDSLGMYFDTTIKTTNWKETSCESLRTGYRSPYACR